MRLDGKNVLLGVSGSIAAYKAADICSRLGESGADVHVTLTRNAQAFVGPATFRALTRNPVLCDIMDEPHARRIVHIDLAQSADIVLIAPASANILAKIAHGAADDVVTTCVLATPAATPVLAAPAMNSAMWEHPATVANLRILRERGVEVIQPGYGILACQDVGLGKLADVDEIVRAVCDRVGRAKDLAGRKVLVTAGATREPLDPVRFLSNRSSGKMGFAIAAEAAVRGADVVLISGHATAIRPAGMNVTDVDSAAAMLEAAHAAFPACDLLVAAAAVSDYAPETVARHKIKKSTSPATGLTLKLRPTPDILATLAASKRDGQVIVGFAAETQNVEQAALAKVKAKGLDLVVANDVTAPGAGFDSDTNTVTLVWPNGRTLALPELPKREVARRLLDAVLPLLRHK